jgi:dipeptidyl aminopeptidase/acylaminoacyl peptidase
VEDYQKYDAYAAAEKIKVPTLIVHGTADELVPFAQSQKLLDYIPSATLVPIEGSDHRFTDPKAFEEMTKTTADFIISQAR